MRYLALGLLFGWLLLATSAFPDRLQPVTEVMRSEEPVPKYVEEWGGLFIRVGNDIHSAPPEDVEVAKRYPRIPWKDRKLRGSRTTILTAKKHYKCNEPVRVIHVHEVSEPGHRVYIMGPQEIYDEYVDGIRVSPDPPRVFSIMGMCVASPVVNYNYEITEYRFAAPGRHQIRWGTSNILNIIVEN